MALFRQAPRSADLIAQNDVELLVIKNERLDWLIRNRPQLAVELVRRLSNWVVQTDRERALRQPMTEPLRVPVRVLVADSPLAHLRA